MITLKKDLKQEPLYMDLLFKEALVHPDNRRFLEYFLETFLELEENSLKDKVEIIEEYVPKKNTLSEKKLRLDLLVKFDETLVNIEMYSCLNKIGTIKSTTYAMKLFSNLKMGENYKNLKKVVQLNFIKKEKMKEKLKEIEEKYNLRSMKTGRGLLEDEFTINYYYVDNKATLNYNETKKKIIKIIGAETIAQREKIAKGDENLMEFNEWLKEYIYDEKSVKLMEEMNKRWMYSQAKDIGHDEGLVEGRVEGISIGRSEGISIGRTEANFNTAEIMLKDKVDEKTVAKYTGLNQNEIKLIKDRIV